MIGGCKQVQEFDVGVIGCGPAGLSAAVNAKIRGKSVQVFGAEICSPKLERAPWVDNYLGFAHVSGEDLRDKFVEHAHSMGLQILRSRVDSIYPDESGFTIIAKAELYHVRSLVIATGISYASYLPGERDFLGRGVSYCGTCDGPLYRGKTVAVVAYTAEGIQEANYLSTVAGKVYFIPQMESWEGLDDSISVITGKPAGILGDQKVTHLVCRDNQLAIDGVFIFRDVTPAEQMLAELDVRRGEIVVDRSLATNVPGVFAAGDCTGRPFQLAKAVGEGLVAGLSAAAYIEKLVHDN